MIHCHYLQHGISSLYAHAYAPNSPIGIVIKNWSRESDLSRRPFGYEPNELPTAPSRNKFLAPTVGLEPTTYALTAHRSTIELHGN